MMRFLLSIFLLPSNIFNYVLLRIKKVKKGHNLRINGRIGIYGDGNIIIGDNVTIHSMPRFNPIGGVKTLLQTRNGGRIVIGNNVGMSHCAITAYECVEIKDNVLIGSGVRIFDTDFHSLDYDIRIGKKPGKPTSKAIIIDEGAFIGTMSIVLKGVHIGKHSIVGAGSIVTKDIPDQEIWAGNPAKFIRKLENTIKYVDKDSDHLSIVQ